MPPSRAVCRINEAASITRKSGRKLVSQISNHYRCSTMLTSNQLLQRFGCCLCATVKCGCSAVRLVRPGDGVGALTQPETPSQPHHPGLRCLRTSITIRGRTVIDARVRARARSLSELVNVGAHDN